MNNANISGLEKSKDCDNCTFDTQDCDSYAFETQNCDSFTFEAHDCDNCTSKPKIVTISHNLKPKIVTIALFF